MDTKSNNSQKQRAFTQGLLMDKRACIYQSRTRESNTHIAKILKDAGYKVEIVTPESIKDKGFSGMEIDCVWIDEVGEIEKAI